MTYLILLSEIVIYCYFNIIHWGRLFDRITFFCNSSVVVTNHFLVKKDILLNRDLDGDFFRMTFCQIFFLFQKNVIGRKKMLFNEL
jgi:hypothetical protein